MLKSEQKVKCRVPYLQSCINVSRNMSKMRQRSNCYLAFVSKCDYRVPVVASCWTVRGRQRLSYVVRSNPSAFIVV